MLLSKKDLGKIAADFLEVLARERVGTMEALESRLGTKLSLNNGMSDEIVFGVGNSQNGTNAWYIDYCREGLGLPIEIRLNRTLDYSKFIVKCEQEIKGYSPFAADPFGNIVQMKTLRKANMDFAISELSRL